MGRSYRSENTIGPRGWSLAMALPKLPPFHSDGVVTISVAQLSYLLSGIDCCMPQATRPASPPRPPKGHTDLRSEHQSSIREITNRYFRFAPPIFVGVTSDRVASIFYLSLRAA